MTKHKVLRQRLHEPRILKSGFSWPAGLFSIAWLFYNRLWSQAVVWIGLLLACRYLHALLDAGAFAAGRLPLTVALAAGYAALVLVPGLMGNRWLERRLLAEGYEAQNTAAAPLAG
jgi:hypothetical protein